MQNLRAIKLKLNPFIKKIPKPLTNKFFLLALILIPFLLGITANMLRSEEKNATLQVVVPNSPTPTPTDEPFAKYTAPTIPKKRCLYHFYGG